MTPILAAELALVGGLCTWAAWRAALPQRWCRAAGVLLLALAALLLANTDWGPISVLVAAVGGVGLGLAVPVPAPAPSHSARWAVAATATGGALALGLLLWVGANDPGVHWFGPMISHGPRHRDQVAITFDDGPDPVWSLTVRDLLAARGVKATFFEVGKAVDAFPEVARALHDDGHLLANHSYDHDYWRWLDPRYPELDRTQDAFRRQLGLCPALFRPPHGQRTPFMLRQAAHDDMHTVTWDVSAQDWSDENGERVARRILDEVQPGSIILLHDGLDGEPGADRSVLRRALPRIIEGLEAKGLQPVRLDELLDVPGYVEC